MNGHPLVPNAEDLIGFVTTGSFSLSEGHGMAIGSIAVEKVLDNVKKCSKEGRYCIVRNAGESVGWLAKWEAA
jgi:ribonuclease P/MRP protein subunit POP1